ncbi:PCNA-associated factor-like [Centruroides sculpturatus]|uniref:PCNA-associated factor-like n=1 Tax=Centruroides sculpturatus TaxID=218467 RepID=UPI000C6D6595|nr:PCNA-associated factor-like [Centruroides sculpturatus]
MARTKADSCSRKAVAAKAPRKVMSSGASTSKVKSNKSSGRSPGNRYCPRPTPPWQKEISRFLVKSPRDSDEQDNSEISSSSSATECFSEPNDLNESGPSKSYQVISEESD